MLLPILEKGIDINGPDELNLLEDSMLVRLLLKYLIIYLAAFTHKYLVLRIIYLQLWEATLSHAPAMVPQLLAYFPCLVEILERNFDQLKVRFLELFLSLLGSAFIPLFVVTHQESRISMAPLKTV